MKRLAAVLIVVAALLVFPAVPSDAQRGHGGGGHSGGHGGGHSGGHGGGRAGGHGAWHGGGWRGGGHHGGWHSGHRGWGGSVIVGAPLWWWDPLFPYAYPYGYYPPSHYAYPSVVEQDQPSVYVQQELGSAAAPPQMYWYYCPSAEEYYPTVEKCREAWVKVPPRPE